MQSPGELAYEMNCLTCHGELGVGTDKAREIQHPVRDYATWVVRNGRAGDGFPMPMPAHTVEMLSDEELTAIFDYLDTPPQPTTGQALFHDYCANCHGADANGGPVMHGITMDAAEIPENVRGGHHPGEFGNRTEFMPAFTTERISDAEVLLIQAYVESLP